MGNITMSDSDTKVSAELAAEIDSIKVETGSESDTVTYAPQAWTREGRVD